MKVANVEFVQVNTGPERDFNAVPVTLSLQKPIGKAKEGYHMRDPEDVEIPDDLDEVIEWEQAEESALRESRALPKITTSSDEDEYDDDSDTPDYLKSDGEDYLKDYPELEFDDISSLELSSSLSF